jgi:ABC-type branched-subunit amino acid transport system ATPase component
VSLLQTIGLKKHFGDTRAVDGVDFTVSEGEFLSLVGSNGAGKTTLVNLISAYLHPDAGQILFDERDITFSSVNDRVRAGIALAIFSRQGKTGNLMTLADHDDDVTREADDVLGQFGLAAHRDVSAGGLAQGERKLLDVAVAYALRPRLLFLDEPTSGVSTRDKLQIMDTISGVQVLRPYRRDARGHHPRRRLAAGNQEKPGGRHDAARRHADQVATEDEAVPPCFRSTISIPIGPLRISCAMSRCRSWSAR